MNKEDVLKMNNSQEIMKAIAQDFTNLLDEETSNHLKEVKRAENKKDFGVADTIYTPPKRSNF